MCLHLEFIYFNHFWDPYHLSTFHYIQMNIIICMPQGFIPEIYTVYNTYYPKQLQRKLFM